MSLFEKNGRSFAMLAAAAVCATAFTSAFAGGHGEKIEFSDPGTPVGASNLTQSLNPGLNRLNPTPSGFKQVQEDLFGPLKNSMHNVDSMQGVMDVPLGPQQQPQRPSLNRRSKELMEQRRNWAFTDLNDLYPDPTIEEALGVKQFGADGKEQEPVSLIQRYYERQDVKPAQKKNPVPGQTESWNGQPQQGYNGLNTFNPNNSLLPVTEPNRKNPFAPDSDEDKSVATFRPSDPSAAPDDSLAAQKHREDFSHLLDPNAPRKDVTLFGQGDPLGLKSTTSSLFKDPLSATAQQAAQQQPHRSTIDPVMAGVQDPTMQSHVYGDLTAAALGQPGNFKAPVSTPPAPKTAESIQRMMDPFAAALGKPKF